MRKGLRQRWKFPLSASHINLYVALGLYISVALCGIGATLFCLLNSYIDSAVNILIGLFSFVGIAGSVSIGFYSEKAKSENAITADDRKYANRLDMAKEIHADIRNNALNGDAVTLLQALINDCGEHVATSGIGIPENNEYSVSSIMEELSNESGVG